MSNDLILRMQRNDNMNVRTFLDYYDRLKALALSRFEWVGLPETCNQRFLERVLFSDGIACFCKHPTNGGILSIRTTPSAELNVYEESTHYRAYSVGFEHEYPLDDIVIVRNNYMCKSTESSLELFALRLANVERTIDINMNAQKTPVIIRCDEKERVTFKNLFNQYDGNAPIIFGTKSLDTEKFKVFKTDAPFLIDKLNEQKRNLWNEALAFLGINSNPSADKRERLITDEVNANNEQTETMLMSNLATRLQACEELRNKFGIDATVRLREIEGKEIQFE